MARAAIRYDPAEFINTGEEATAYLKAAAEDGDPEVLDAALADIVRAAHSNRKEAGMASKAMARLVDTLTAVAEEHEELARVSAREGYYSNALMYKQEANAYAKAAEIAFTALRAEIEEQDGEDGPQQSCTTCQHFAEVSGTDVQGVCMAYERGVDEAPVWVYETEGSCSDWKEKE